MSKKVEGMVTGDIVISFKLISKGMTGPEWIAHFKARKIPVSRNAEAILLSSDFKPTPAGTVHHVRVLKGIALHPDDRYSRRITETAQKAKLRTPHPEIAPLMRDAFLDEDIRRMGLEEIATFHTHIGGRILDIDTETGELESAPAGEDDTWHKEHGFAFEE